MQTTHPEPFEQPGWGNLFAHAGRYWEPRRLIYNALLLAVTAGWVIFTWPLFRPALTWSSLPPMIVLALLANLCYSAAYLIDIPMQLSALGESWKRRRWIVFLVGTIFALVLASYWIADEISADFR